MLSHVMEELGYPCMEGTSAASRIRSPYTPVSLRLRMQATDSGYGDASHLHADVLLSHASSIGTGDHCDEQHINHHSCRYHYNYSTSIGIWNTSSLI
jgi:hypothetical protein